MVKAFKRDIQNRSVAKSIVIMLFPLKRFNALTIANVPAAHRGCE
jgi:hypothetical protein